MLCVESMGIFWDHEKTYYTQYIHVHMNTFTNTHVSIYIHTHTVYTHPPWICTRTHTHPQYPYIVPCIYTIPTSYADYIHPLQEHMWFVLATLEVMTSTNTCSLPVHSHVNLTVPMAFVYLRSWKSKQYVVLYLHNTHTKKRQTLTSWYCLQLYIYKLW